MRTFHLLLIPLLFAPLLLLACTEDPDDFGGDDDTEGGDDDDDTGDDDTIGETFPEIAVGDWEPCAWIPGEDITGAECAEAELPMDYGDPDGDVFPMLVKRRPGEPGAGQHWVMHGGPGGSALDDMSFLVYSLPTVFPDLTYYAVDHRGIGGSDRLGCPDQESLGSDGGEDITDAEWADCVESLEDQWGDDLDHFTTTDSARDVATLVQNLRVDDEPVYVWGGSYGTYLAQRYMQVAPQQPTAVILEGISAPGQGFIDYDRSMDNAGQKLMALCAATPSCADHFDGDPWTVAGQVVDSIDQGHCATLDTDSDFWRNFLGYALFYDKVRDVVPAIVHRLERCNPDDVDVIVQLYYRLFESESRRIGGPELPPWPGMGPRGGNDGFGFSYPLFFHIALSEMWDTSVAGDPEDLYEEWLGYTMSTGREVTLAAMLDAGWPTFPIDDYNGGLSPYDGPLLMLQGGFDAATAPEHLDELRAHYTADHQTWALFPQGAHGLVGGTLTSSGADCAFDLYAELIEDPEAPLDTSCLDDLAGVDFDGYPEYNQWYLGTSDAWGD